MAQGPIKGYRTLTQIYIGAYPPEKILALVMEARGEGEDEPHRFEVALTEEQATAIVEELTRGLERIR